MTERKPACDPWALAALHLYAQVSVGLAMYLYGAVSTPAWLSVLLSAPLLTLLVLLVRRFAAAGPVPRRILFLPGIACLADALYAFCALCSLLRDLSPDLDIALAASAYALILGSALFFAPDRDALPRLAKMALPVLLPLFLFSLGCALSRGRAGHLFPLMGFGPASVLRGALWVFGASAGAAAPLFIPGRTESRALPRLLFALLAAAVTAAAAAWLLPGRALAADSAVGWRLMLISHTTPSVPCWSAQAATGLVLLMLSVCTGVRQGTDMLARCAGKTGKKSAAALLFLLLLALAGAARDGGMQAFLADAGPWRAAPTLAAAMLLALRRKEKT